MDGVGKIKGEIDFYMDDQLIRRKSYRFSKDRRTMIEDWMEEIKHIQYRHSFYYEIKPDLSQVQVKSREINRPALRLVAA